tara:strand:- start:1377 stop:1781 length:405 start_codon:yes stop_codon:yes gene_type:complete
VHGCRGSEPNNRRAGVDGVRSIPYKPRFFFGNNNNGLIRDFRVTDSMAHHSSAKKRIRRNTRAGIVNHARLSRIRGLIKVVETAIGSGDQPAAIAALKQMEPELMRGARKGVVHKNTASRKLSRLSARVKSIAA